eukprot:365817-Chlamydomonas_euryale.AAC.33
MQRTQPLPAELCRPQSAAALAELQHVPATRACRAEQGSAWEPAAHLEAHRGGVCASLTPCPGRRHQSACTA